MSTSEHPFLCGIPKIVPESALQRPFSSKRPHQGVRSEEAHVFLVGVPMSRGASWVPMHRRTTTCPGSVFRITSGCPRVPPTRLEELHHKFLQERVRINGRHRLACTSVRVAYARIRQWMGMPPGRHTHFGGSAWCGWHESMILPCELRGSMLDRRSIHAKCHARQQRQWELRQNRGICGEGALPWEDCVVRKF